METAVQKIHKTHITKQLLTNIAYYTTTKFNLPISHIFLGAVHKLCNTFLAIFRPPSPHNHVILFPTPPHNLIICCCCSDNYKNCHHAFNFDQIDFLHNIETPVYKKAKKSMIVFCFQIAQNFNQICNVWKFLLILFIATREEMVPLAKNLIMLMR